MKRKNHLSLVSTCTGGFSITVGLIQQKKKIAERNTSMREKDKCKKKKKASLKSPKIIPEPCVSLYWRSCHSPIASSTPCTVTTPWLESRHTANKWGKLEGCIFLCFRGIYGNQDGEDHHGSVVMDKRRHVFGHWIFKRHNICQTIRLPILTARIAQDIASFTFSGL